MKHLQKNHKPNNKDAVPIIRQKKQFTINKGEVKFQRSQFPLTLAYAMTAYKCQGETLQEVIIDFSHDSRETVSVQNGSFYVALTRVKEGKDVYLKSFDEKYITFNRRVEEKIEYMRRFKQYNFKKTYVSDPIFADDKEETKIGYINIQGFLESNHAKYVDKDLNLLSLNILVCSETWLTEKNPSNEIIKKLENWNVIKRLDATDNKKHMGLILMIPKGKEETMKLVFDMDYVESYTDDKSTLLYQGLTMNLTKHYKKIVFLYIRKTPNRKETKGIAQRFIKYDCIIGDLNLNPALREQKEKLEMICGKDKYLALEEITTIRYNQLDHIILKNDLSNISFSTAYNNFCSDHKSIVLRLATKKTTFLKEFAENVYFDMEKHLKASKRDQSKSERKASNEKTSDKMNQAFLEETEVYEELEVDQSNIDQDTFQIHPSNSNKEETKYHEEVEEVEEVEDDHVSQSTKDENVPNLIDDSIGQNYLLLPKFNNPPRQNLCFSNVIATCLLNIPILRQYLQEARNEMGNRESIKTELSNLLKAIMINRSTSTRHLRGIVMSKCIELGQANRKFNNNMQFDCVEFLESLLEHFWNEPFLPASLNESVFGGLYQESFICECGNEDKHPIKSLPDILSVPVEGYTTQTCLDSFLEKEEIERTCPACQSLKGWKNKEIIVPPSTLILQLKRFSFEEDTYSSKKLHVPISCPLVLYLKNETKYQLNMVVNHIGETASSGHYNILLNDRHHNKFILVDDLEIRSNPVLDDMDKMSYVIVYTRQ